MRKKIYKILFWWLKNVKPNDWIEITENSPGFHKVGDYVYENMNNHKIIWWKIEDSMYFYLAVKTTKKRKY